MANTRARSVHIYPGWFQNTLKEYSGGDIAVLRLDGDWYQSTMECLQSLWRHVASNGLVLIDDYYSFSGCSRAVHDFLSSISAEEQIRQSGLAGVAYIRKR
jgi:O-methyltransferase